MIERRPFVQKVLKNRQSNLRVVSGLGTSTWDLMSGGDDKANLVLLEQWGRQYLLL